MGRKSKYNIGDVYGGLEVLEVISEGSGKHVKLKCFCKYCETETIMNGVSLYKRNSCGCQQNNSEIWKRKGPKTKPWQLPSGESARRNVEYGYKRSAKKRNISYTLTTEQFNEVVGGNCFYCGDKHTNIKKGQGKTSGDFMYTGIDRIDSNKGYDIDNVVSCCWRCNNMKNTLSVDDFIGHIKKILNNLGE